MSKTMKWCMLLIASVLTTNLYATYYVVGNGGDDPNGGWCNSKNWVVDASENVLDVNNSITFYNVAAGKNYGFKITDGQWGSGHEFTTIDYDYCDAPMYGGNGNDMGFRLSEDADVTISFVDGKVRLHATKPLAYRSNYYYIAGNGATTRGTWCSQKEWSANDASSALVNDQISFTALPGEWYEFKITNGSWDKTWGYTELNVAESSPMHKTYGDGNNICFRLTEAANVTIKMVNNKVVLLIDREYNIVGNGNGAWLGGQDWGAKNDNSKLDANLSRTYYNLPVGSYEFKIKDYVNAWSMNDDCTWGYAHLDTDNSNIGENNNGNIKFTLSLPADVTIAIVNNKIRLNTSPVYYIAGNGDVNHGAWCNQKYWWTDEPNSRLDAETFSKTYTSLPAGKYVFKLTNGRWAADGGTVWAAAAVDYDSSSQGYRGSGDDDDIEFDLQAPTDVTISFNPETGKISLVSSNGYFLSDVYSVIGDEALLGFDWALSETSTEMTDKHDGTYTYTMPDKYLTPDNYDYKIVGGHRWGKGCEYPQTNATLDITEAGYYTVVFTLNPVAMTQTCVATRQTKDVTISAYQFASFYGNKAYEIPDGLQAYIFTDVQNEMLVMEEIDVIPALTGVVLYGAANAVYSMPETQSNVTYPDNLLKGSLTNETINNSKVHYILTQSADTDEFGMYWPYNTTNGVGAFTNHAGKAYLELNPGTAPSNVKGFVLRTPQTATGIQDVTGAQDDTKWYDLLGRPVDQPTQGGVYIHQGKKIVVF